MIVLLKAIQCKQFCVRMVYAIRHEATTLDPVGGGPEKAGGSPAIS
jgi:hypothetical protein